MSLWKSHRKLWSDKWPLYLTKYEKLKPCTSRGQSHTKYPSDFSSRYQRILKKKQTDQCSDSLAWLEAEGYSAVKLSLWNEKTKKLEQIYFSKDDLLGPDEGMCEYFTLYSVMNCNHCRCCCARIRNRCFEHDDLCERQVQHLWWCLPWNGTIVSGNALTLQAERQNLWVE